MSTKLGNRYELCISTIWVSNVGFERASKNPFLAVIFFKMEKFTLSSLYLAKAAQANDNDLQQLPRVDAQTNGRPLVTLSLSKKTQLLRNYGVIKLFAGQNKEGLEYFQKLLK